MSKPIIVTADNWREVVIESPVPVLVDFWAPRCSPCVQLTPAIEELAEEFADRARVVKVNVDEDRALPMVWQIMGIPALLFFSHGEKVHELMGFQDKKVLADKLEELIGQD